jgi:hypothetical protein
MAKDAYELLLLLLPHRRHCVCFCCFCCDRHALPSTLQRTP